MSTTTRSVSATPEQVWEVLSDGWLYPLFVVGASRMRDVDESWPAVGAKLHHSVGTWPLLIDDTTEVVEIEEGKRLLLLARGWPAGQAHVDISLQPDGDTTVVTIVEDATAGPGLLCPSRCATCSCTGATSRPCDGWPSSWRAGRSERRLAGHVRRRRGRGRPQRAGRGQPPGGRRLAGARARGAADAGRRGPQRPRGAPRLRPRHVQRVLPAGSGVARDHRACGSRSTG